MLLEPVTTTSSKSNGRLVPRCCAESSGDTRVAGVAGASRVTIRPRIDMYQRDVSYTQSFLHFNLLYVRYFLNLPGCRVCGGATPLMGTMHIVYTSTKQRHTRASGSHNIVAAEVEKEWLLRLKRRCGNRRKNNWKKV